MPVDVLARNNVHVTGQGTQPMLFAHGFGCDQHMWRYVVPAFEENYRTILFDYVGAGKSDLSAYHRDRYASLQGYVDDVLDICRALDLRDTVLVCHSVSCMVGVLAAIQAPQHFDHLVLIGPSPRYINDESGYRGGFERKDIEGLLDTMQKNYIGWANFMAPVITQNPDRPEVGEELAESFCSTDPVIARQFAEVTFFGDNRGDLARVPVPALVMQCSDDLIAPDEVGAFVHEALPASTFRHLTATGHCPHMSHPDEVIAVMREYLDTAYAH